jgi:hypothetical protein
VAKKAFDLYGVLDTDDWLARLDNSYLTGAQKEQVKETAYITLVILADYGTRWKKSNPRVERSLDQLNRATKFHEPTRAKVPIY